MKIPTLDDLKSKITAGGGFSNPSLYYVSLPTRNLNGEQKQSIEFFVKSINLPSRNLLSVDREVGMDIDKVAYGYSNPSIQMTFRVLNDQLTRQYIEDWQNSIISRYDTTRENHYTVSYPDDYMKDIRIFQLDRGIAVPVIDKSVDFDLGIVNVNLDLDVDLTASGRVIYTWHLERAYPVSFTQETLSDDAKGTVSEITVEFSYRNWRGYQLQGGRTTNIDTSTSITTDIGSRIGKKIYDVLKF